MTHNKPNKSKKIYRFAVYGRASSGKTCILAALAMKCIANPRKLTSTWILDPSYIKKPVGDPEDWDPQDPAVAYHLGREWLEKSIFLLSRNQLPPPNPNRAAPLRYLYHFTTPEHITYHIELIDYSGELIDPAISDDEMVLRLHDHINSMDGILVLAEAPRPGRDPQPLSNELHKLEQAFVILKGTNNEGPILNVPVALLINKWDRISTIDHANFLNEQKKLDEFLAGTPEPPHLSLINTLRNSVTAKNFHVFPVSAFGEYEFTATADTGAIERPKQINPLKSFGLEDGFVWAANRRDEIDLSRYEEEVSRRASICLWKSKSIIPAWGLLKTSKELFLRFPAHSPERIRVKSATRKISLAVYLQTICFTIMLLLLPLSGEMLHDGFRYRSVLVSENNPQATNEKLLIGEEWLEAYYKSPIYQHVISSMFVLSRNHAIKTLEKLRNKRDEKLWQPVATAGDQVSRLALARKYLEQFGENGKYRDLAESIITTADSNKKYHGDKIYLAGIAASLEALLIQGDFSEIDLQGLQEQLERIPYPLALNDELFMQQRWLQEQISSEKIKLAKAEGRARWVEFREKYFSLVRDRKINQAAAHLSQWQTRGDEEEKLADLKKDFKKRVIGIIKEDVSERHKAKQWRDARDIIQTIIDDKHAVSFLNSLQLKNLHLMLDEVDIAEDQDLYEKITSYKDMEQVSYYLKHAPLNKMKRVVERYQVYLNQVANPMLINLQLNNIYWAESCGNTDILLTLNGKTVIEKNGLTARKHGRSAQVGNTLFRAKMNDTIKIHMETICNGIWDKEKTGEITWEGLVRNLNGLRIGLDGDQAEKNAVTFILSGVPQEPVLPPWGD
ncbi:MAG: hypothetical protein KKB30_07415 [Proteobacteria bacterium]|nr:hypothetical protein [Pseudomonadota bacterium]MBU1714973.1 hypothetical protein [Pseudomonadota bacterium]